MALTRNSESGFSVHPGEILKQEFMTPMKISGYALAKALGVPAQAISDIVRKKRGISADMAIRLATYLGTSAQFWMNLQNSFELANARKSLRKEIAKIKPAVRVA